MDSNDKTNPVLELGIKSGVNLAAERLLSTGKFDLETVADMLELSKKQIEFLTLKGYK